MRALYGNINHAGDVGVTYVHRSPEEGSRKNALLAEGQEESKGQSAETVLIQGGEVT